MRPSVFQKPLDLLKLKEGLLEYFRLCAENRRSESDAPYPAQALPVQTREAALT